jgi:hypothetical protein
MRVLAAILCLLLIAAAAHAEAPGKRIALVVGNSGYRNVERLANPANDARLIAETLRAAGFTLVGGGAQLDVDKAAFDRVVQQFGRQLGGADVALFYYSGHGMQVQGTNWLVPIDANPSSAKDLDFQMVDAALVLHQMEGAGTKLNLMVLDACRNNPFAVRGVRGTNAGLAEMHAPEGTIISYATQPGNVALDGTGADSPYSTALARAMRQPGLDIFRVFNEVGLNVKQATGGVQLPWLASSPVAGNFYFFNNGPVTIVLPPVPQAAAPASSAAFDGDWMGLVTCDNVREAQGYHWEFPATVRQGRLHGVHGTLGQPDSLEFIGTIDPDGTARHRAPPARPVR